MSARRVLMPLFSVAVMILVVYGYFAYHQLREPLSVEEEVGEVTTWALLVAGSKGYRNYRHQADVCHAYQVLKQGGLEDKNIVVFMFDDIASNVLNQRPGKLINHPDGEDVYAGVPRDYTGASVATENLFAALLGDEKSIRGGSGKVIKSRSKSLSVVMEVLNISNSRDA